MCHKRKLLDGRGGPRSSSPTSQLVSNVYDHGGGQQFKVAYNTVSVYIVSKGNPSGT